MHVGRAGALLGAGAVVLAACSGGADGAEPGPMPDPSPPATTAPTPSDVTATTSTPRTSTATTATTTTTTTTTAPGREQCVVTVAPGDSFSAIADRFDDVEVDDLLEENLLADGHVIHPGDELDVCVGNDVDDITGTSRLPPDADAVMAQQQRLNELFAPYSMLELAIDGDSGPLTRQALCAARMGLGRRVSATDMSEGSPEEEALFEADGLSIPEGAATWANRWILIDKTCQVVFTGEGDDRIVDIFPTSTGEPGYETHDVLGVAAFRFDPALDNEGWHDSTRFPVEIDNPLNGNMYKPIYFNGGQAIHGANYVPPEPNSKGCARLFPWHQDRLIAWLGLDDLTQPTWVEQRIAATVTVQGQYRPIDD